jgi:hypothetical protein
MDHVRVTTFVAPVRDPEHRRFRLAVVVASVVAAAVGSVVLATRDSGERATTRGIAAVLRVPGHPGAIVAGTDVLWVALNGDPRKPVGERSLLRLDLATGTVVQTVRLGGEASYLARDGERLIASVRPAGGREFGPRRLVALDWHSGVVLPLGESHLSDTDAQEIDGPVDQVVRAGNFVWALESRPGRLLQLDPSTLAPLSAPIRLSSGRTLGLAAGDGHLWVTATDAGEILRIDPATRAIARVHVGGSPVGITVADGRVWFTDPSEGDVVRVDPRSLRLIGDRIPVGAKPTRLGVAGDSLFVTDEDAGMVMRIDAHSGRRLDPPIRFGAPAQGALAPALASTGESVWVSSFSSSTVTRIIPPSSLSPPSGEMTIQGIGYGRVNAGPSGAGVTNGGVAGTGRFTATGAIADSGTYIAYRRVRGKVARVRDVLVGKKGTITIVITIDLGTESPAPWAITAGTQRYAGLHGRGTLTVDNYEANPYTFVLKGMVSRRH